MKPGEVAEYKWSLHGIDHTFLKGHRMMVEVQSSWFPLYDRNPQTYVENIMTAPAGAYQAETVSIFGSANIHRISTYQSRPRHALPQGDEAFNPEVAPHGQESRLGGNFCESQRLLMQEL